jgi:hypothetical protein
MKWLLLIIIQTFLLNDTFAKVWHVTTGGNNKNNGSQESPFQTIQQASSMAFPGDTILVHEGIYRELVNPIRGGNSAVEPIVYMAAKGEKVVIKGSEVIDDWQRVDGTVWKVTLANEYFSGHNPFATLLEGDWLDKKGVDHHTGEVFLNGRALFEKSTLEQVMNPQPYPDATQPQAALFAWYSQADETHTTIWANFQEYHPNRELVEISVREACIYPDRPGRNYITINGFELEQAATQWAAPTAEQPGIIGTHWSKGWIIEHNTIRNSKSVGISLGKERATGHNVWMHKPEKDGATHYNEVIFRALEIGWSKEQIGGHVVRNNDISYCGQAGIVGSLGAVYSKIYHNHIHHIWERRTFAGAEMAGIKIHASVDMEIRDNHIHNTGRGIWLDWMAQGTQVTGNLLYDNTTDDLFSEVNHGPYLVDNNIFLSPVAIRDWSEGGAFVHNFIAGKIMLKKVRDRFTPYLLPHSTKVAGLRNIYNGDNRFYNNIFVQTNMEDTKWQHEGELSFYGTTGYGDAAFPNHSAGNVYYNGAQPGRGEQNYIVIEHRADYKIEEKDSNAIFSFIPSSNHHQVETRVITTAMLGTTIISEAIFDRPDGSAYVLDEDYFGAKRPNRQPGAGPFSPTHQDLHQQKIWPKQ